MMGFLVDTHHMWLLFIASTIENPHYAGFSHHFVF